MDRFLVLLLIAFQAICAQDFDFETVLDRNRDFVLKWNFDNESIDVEVSAKTTGWIAFGFSPNGGMDQSDVMFGFVENGTGRGNITVRWRWYLLRTNFQFVFFTKNLFEVAAALQNWHESRKSFMQIYESPFKIVLPYALLRKSYLFENYLDAIRTLIRRGFHNFHNVDLAYSPHAKHC